MENQKKSKMYIVWIVAIGVFAVFFFIGIFGSDSSSENNFNPDPTPVTRNSAPESTQQPVTPSNPNFSEISEADQARIKEIITGVMANSVSVTPDLRNELKSIFKKYGITDEKIADFAIYGPAIGGIYQVYFYTDALETVLSGVPVKSEERLNFEKEALSRGLMTEERIKLNDEEMKQIANHQPITGPDGKQYLLTEETIRSTLINIEQIIHRMESLFI